MWPFACPGRSKSVTGLIAPAAWARRKLTVLVLAFLAAVAVPLALIAKRTLGQIENTALLRHQLSVGELTARIEDKLAGWIQVEENRGPDQYNFYAVSENRLVQQKNVTYSPLAAFPPAVELPGLIGFFQIYPDGTVHSPTLPDVLEEQMAMDAAEFSRREQARLILAAVLKDTSLLQQRSQRAEHQGRPVSQLETAPDYSSRNMNQQIAQQEMSWQLLDRFQKNRQSKTQTWNAPINRSVGQAGVEHIGPVSGVVDPFNMTRSAAAGALVFFRKVRLNELMVTQGFIVGPDQFFDQSIRALFEASTAANTARVALVYGDKILRGYQAGSVWKSDEPLDGSDLIIYRKKLIPPFNDLELVYVLAQPLAAQDEARVLQLLLVILALVLLGGSCAIYRLGLAQIRLAQQRAEFVSSVTHELKTPLTSIRMYSEMLRADYVKDEAKLKSYHDFIFFESERLSRLITNVLTLSKLGSKGPELQLKEEDPEGVLFLLAGRVSSQAAAAGFELQLARENAEGEGERAGSFTILVDTDAVIQIFVNLVDNALKYSRGAPEKKITVGYRIEPQGRKRRVEFYVRDFGPGIENRDRKKIFGLFYRPQNELTKSTPGTGIGLALVKELAGRMGAAVECRNQNPGLEVQVVWTL